MINVLILHTNKVNKAIDMLHNLIVDDKILFGDKQVKHKNNFAPFTYVFHKEVLNIIDDKKISLNNFNGDLEKTHIYPYIFTNKFDAHHNLIQSLEDSKMDIHINLLKLVKKLYLKEKQLTFDKKVYCKHCQSHFSRLDKLTQEIEQDGTFIPSVLEYSKFALPLQCTFCGSFDLILNSKDANKIKTKLNEILVFNDEIDNKIIQLKKDQKELGKKSTQTSGFIALLTDKINEKH